MKFRSLLPIVTMAFLSCTVPGPAVARGSAFYPPWGFDLTAFDRSTKPGDDFFQFAAGGYLERTVIPADRAIASRRWDMIDRTDAQLKALLENAARGVRGRPRTLQDKIGTFYASYMDEKQVEAAGSRPIAKELSAIRSADRSALARLMGSAPGSLYPSPFAVGIDIDFKSPGAYAVYIGQNGLGLPDRDYYLDPKFQKQREAYQLYAARLLSAVGWQDAEGQAKKLVELETALAKASWSRAEQRDLTAQYHPTSTPALARQAPGFDWAALLEGAGVSGRERYVVTTNSALPRLAAVLADAPLETVRAWMAFRTADTAAPYLSRNFLDAYFDFREKALAGQAEPKPRWKRAMAAVGGTECVDATTCLGTMNWGVGELYSAKHFPATTKAAMKPLLANLTAAFRARIEKLDWMGASTRAEALKKLDTYQIKVGFPDRPRDYSLVEIRRDDLLGNVRRLATANWQFYTRRSLGPVDKSDWVMTPQTNNAYNGWLRDIVFPAAILQAPVFDPNADAAINYGAIGAIIGHELTHGFDDQGRTIDASGALRDWWTPEDAKAFDARAAILGAQFAKYEPVAGSFINPALTMGENIADLGGFAMALDAYHLSLKGRPGPVLDGLTGEQRVFLGWAQAWAGKATAEEIKRYTASDPHSFRKYRVNGIVRNIDRWYTAFGVQPGDAMYIPPAGRARIW